MSRQDRFLRSNAQQKERAWERRRTCFAAASEEIRPDGEFPERQLRVQFSHHESRPGEVHDGLAELLITPQEGDLLRRR